MHFKKVLFEYLLILPQTISIILLHFLDLRERYRGVHRLPPENTSVLVAQDLSNLFCSRIDNITFTTRRTISPVVFGVDILESVRETVCNQEVDRIDNVFVKSSRRFALGFQERV